MNEGKRVDKEALRQRYYISRLNQLMGKKKMTYVKLSVLSGLPISTIKNSVNKTKNPTIKTLEKICDGLGISIIDFYDTEEYRRISEMISDESSEDDSL